MPIYEYRCERGHTFEVMQRMSDDPVASCETCDAPVARVFHPVAVHFKGSGFYNTDYGTRKRAREKAESSEGSSAAKDGGEKKTESKPEQGSKADSGAKTETSSPSTKASSPSS